MPLFALPVDPSAIRPTLRAHLYPRSPSKRKRGGPEETETFNPALSYSELKPPTSSHSDLALASTNPFSLSADEVHQYRVAGLELDQELPSKSIPDFPHRGLPKEAPVWGDSGGEINKNSGDGDALEEVEDRAKEVERTRRVSKLRTQHLGVLTGILHRCLLSGDIPRAKRAWAMLLRTEVNGKGVDIRSTGYWGIGAELLIRGEERAKTQPGQGEDNDESLLGREDNGHNSIKIGNQDITEQRWGTPAGLEKAKEYYERLILQHPYRRQFSTSVNSLDFWPAMLGCEIYGIQYTQTEALRLVVIEEQHLEDASDDVPLDDEDFVDNEDGEDDYFTRQTRLDARKSARIQEVSWQKRDTIRRAALLAAEKLAARMDELMTSPPYSDNVVLHRLRGMVALYIGDLTVPELPLSRDRRRRGRREDEDERSNEDDDDDNDNEEDEEREWFSKKEISDRRFIDRQRRVENGRGMERRVVEVAKARKAFENVKRAGGQIDEELGRLPVDAGVDGDLEE